MDFKHISVMLNECIDALNIKADGIYVDGTAGGAGHSKEIVKRLKNGHLYALDQDPDAIITATKRLSEFDCATVIKTNFSNMKDVLYLQNVHGVDGVLLDLGVSSHQLDEAQRGFSYNADAKLDMRMSQSGVSAKDVVNTYSVADLTRIIRDYGEEKFAKKIALNIEKQRNIKEIETTFELVDIIKKSVPAFSKREKNPAKRTFQAIRIEVNGELEVLKQGLESAFEMLNPNGRLVVLTFHSLEDRIVKQKFASWCKGCTCPADFPQCVCNNKPRARLINKKPIVASNDELEFNSRSKSAKLRILEKI